MCVLHQGVCGQGASLQQGVSGRTSNWRLRRGNLTCGMNAVRKAREAWGGVCPFARTAPSMGRHRPRESGTPAGDCPAPDTWCSRSCLQRAPCILALLSGRGHRRGGPCWGPVASLEARVLVVGLATSPFLLCHIGGAQCDKDTLIQAGLQ